MEGSREDTMGRICVKCRSFRERYRLPGNARVCRNAGAHDEEKVDGEREEGEAGEVRGCARALVEAAPLCIRDKFTSRGVDCAYLVARNFISKTKIRWPAASL